jgi:hypothetical protein
MPTILIVGFCLETILFQQFLQFSLASKTFQLFYATISKAAE